MFQGENLCGIQFFSPIAKVFPLNHLLCTVHDGLGLMHYESFPVNSVFCAQPTNIFSIWRVLYFNTVNYYLLYVLKSNCIAPDF